jgi:hypothetical protein
MWTDVLVGEFVIALVPLPRLGNGVVIAVPAAV